MVVVGVGDGAGMVGAAEVVLAEVDLGEAAEVDIAEVEEVDSVEVVADTGVDTAKNRRPVSRITISFDRDHEP